MLSRGLPLWLPCWRWPLRTCSGCAGLGAIPTPISTLQPPLGIPWEGWWTNLGVRLPGITNDWSFKDNWASSASLAAALFTTVFAAADPLKAILGDADSAKVSAIAVAAALSAAIIGSGPLWLTICKRRYERDKGIAADNTIGGVLMGSVVVLVGALGLLYAAAEILDLPAARAAAAATTAVLLLYSWKSIPQTLALGYFGTTAKATVSASR